MANYSLVDPNEANEIANLVWDDERHRSWSLIDPAVLIVELTQAATGKPPRAGANAMEIVLLQRTRTVPLCDDPHDPIDPRRL